MIGNILAKSEKIYQADFVQGNDPKIFNLYKVLSLLSPTDVES